MTEKDIYRRLKAQYPGFHWQRIETLTGSGVPDVHVCERGVTAWIENKVGHLRVKTDTVRLPNLRPTQVAWMVDYRARGGLVALSIGLPSGIFIVPNPSLDWLSLVKGPLGVPFPELVRASVNLHDWLHSYALVRV